MKLHVHGIQLRHDVIKEVPHGLLPDLVIGGVSEDFALRDGLWGSLDPLALLRQPAESAPQPPLRREDFWHVAQRRHIRAARRQLLERLNVARARWVLEPELQRRCQFFAIVSWAAVR